MNRWHGEETLTRNAWMKLLTTQDLDVHAQRVLYSYVLYSTDGIDA